MEIDGRRFGDARIDLSRIIRLFSGFVTSGGKIAESLVAERRKAGDSCPSP